MGMKKQAAGLLMALALAFTGSVGTLAAQTQTYKETVLTLPAEIMPDQTATDLRVQSLSAHGDRLDLFAEWQPTDSKFITRHFQSLDGGKNWKEQDASWMDALGGDPGSQPYTWVDEDGTIYAVLLGLSPEINLPATSYRYNIGILAAHKDGNTRVITRLGDEKLEFRRVGGVSQQGELLVEMSDVDLEELTGKPPVEKYLVVDAATGRVKSETDKENSRYSVSAYEDGLLLERHIDGKRAFIEAATGKVRQVAAYPEGTDVWHADGGMFYALAESGLYRFRAGETAWTKMLDGSIRKNGTAGSNMSLGRGLAVDEDGSIYVLMKHYHKGDFRLTLKGWTLSRYTPA